MNQENSLQNKNEQEIKVNQEEDEQKVEFKDASTEPYNRKTNEERYPWVKYFYRTCADSRVESRFSPNLAEAQVELKSDLAKILNRAEELQPQEKYNVDEIIALQESLLFFKESPELAIETFNKEHPGKLKNIPRLHKIIDEIRQCIFKLSLKNVDKQFKELSNLIKTLIAEIEFE